MKPMPMPSYTDMLAKIEALRAAGQMAQAEAMNAKLILMTQGAMCAMGYSDDEED
jgi:hypothetical protein